MRPMYLNPSNEVGGGCRGGVGNGDGCGDYELEIGQHKNASAEMIALCVHIDEITTYLKLKQDCPIAQMVLHSYKKTVKEINENLAPQQAPAL
jgi:hypothetical protein